MAAYKMPPYRELQFAVESRAGLRFGVCRGPTLPKSTIYCTYPNAQLFHQDGAVKCCWGKPIDGESGENCGSYRHFERSTIRKENMKIQYDPEVDALYIELRDVHADHNVDIEEGVSVDLDVDGHIVGLEILDASERLKESLLRLELGELSFKKAELKT